MPDLRIVDDELARRVTAELKRRERPTFDGTAAERNGNSNRARHALSGLIRCDACGSSYILAGRDYYRCARNRERGTCGNAVSVRASTIEEAVLAAL